MSRTNKENIDLIVVGSPDTCLVEFIKEKNAGQSIHRIVSVSDMFSTSRTVMALSTGKKELPMAAV